MKRDLISILDVKDEIEEILELAVDLKTKQKAGQGEKRLQDQVLGMIFEKPSLRTRVSFEVGMHQLGGMAFYLSREEVKLGKRESVYDVAKVISRYVDGIMYRAFDNKIMVELAEHADVPVINGLDDIEHPCQILADLLTIKENKGNLKGLKLVYLGDGNNVCNSLLLGCACVGMHMVAACPPGYEPNAEILTKAKEIGSQRGATIQHMTDPKEAVANADVIYTDTWVSMGDEAEKEKRNQVFPPFQVNRELVSLAKPDYIFLHCLPAHRNEEVTDEIIDSPNSKVFDEAENRMHAQKAVLVKLMS